MINKTVSAILVTLTWNETIHSPTTLFIFQLMHDIAYWIWDKDVLSFSIISSTPILWRTCLWHHLDILMMSDISEWYRLYAGMAFWAFVDICHWRVWGLWETSSWQKSSWVYFITTCDLSRAGAQAVILGICLSSSTGLTHMWPAVWYFGEKNKPLIIMASVQYSYTRLICTIFLEVVII